MRIQNSLESLDRKRIALVSSGAIFRQWTSIDIEALLEHSYLDRGVTYLFDMGIR